MIAHSPIENACGIFSIYSSKNLIYTLKPQRCVYTVFYCVK